MAKLVTVEIELSPREERFVELLGSGRSVGAAAGQAGFTTAYGTKLLHNKQHIQQLVRANLERLQKTVKALDASDAAWVEARMHAQRDAA